MIRSRARFLAFLIACTWILLPRSAAAQSGTFYKQIADDRDFAQFFLVWLFDRYYRRAQGREGSGAGP